MFLFCFIETKNFILKFWNLKRFALIIIKDYMYASSSDFRVWEVFKKWLRICIIPEHRDCEAQKREQSLLLHQTYYKDRAQKRVR